MASLIPNVLEGCDSFFFFFSFIQPCWNQPCAVSNWWFVKRCAGVAHSHDNKSEVFTFVFPRDVWARPLLPLNHLIRHAVPAAVVPHQLFVGTISEREHLFQGDKHHRSFMQWSSTCTAGPRYIVWVWLWLKEEALIHKRRANLLQTWSLSQLTVVVVEVLKYFC